MDSLLSLKNIRKSYGDRPIFENLACDFYGASANMILGENGSGKTTLLKLMAG
ncbi:MAG: AAA family ATPase, partial [Desulfovibrio sp.]|nr:AAA family ATPase [Desulfovibrio sp.]